MGAFKDAVLDGLLAGNDSHVRSLTADTFRGLEHKQDPDVVAVCCADSRVPQERMWGVDHPGTLFTPSTIGNQVWDLDGDTPIVDGGVAYAIHHAGAEAIAVVGHTGCGAVAAAAEVATGASPPGPRGVDLWVDQLVPVAERAFSAGIVDPDDPQSTVINELVEVNVQAQVQFLLEADAVPDETTVLGFVYDFQQVYGSDLGRCYVVSMDGETDTDRIAASLPPEHQSVAKSLLG